MIDFYFDYASPWSYLATELLATRLSGAKIVYRPIYLRGLELFSKGLPYTSNKLRYIGQDLLRCAAHENIPIQMPANFPINGLYAVRGALQLIGEASGASRGASREPVASGMPASIDSPRFADYHRAMFHAAWRDNRDVSDKQVVLAVGRELGLELNLDDPIVKERLKRDTAAAETRGVFGVPTFFVGDELFWGHDRMDFVERAWKKGRQET